MLFKSLSRQSVCMGWHITFTRKNSALCDCMGLFFRLVSLFCLTFVCLSKQYWNSEAYNRLYLVESYCWLWQLFCSERALLLGNAELFPIITTDNNHLSEIVYSVWFIRILHHIIVFLIRTVLYGNNVLTFWIIQRRVVLSKRKICCFIALQ